MNNLKERLEELSPNLQAEFWHKVQEVYDNIRIKGFYELEFIPDTIVVKENTVYFKNANIANIAKQITQYTNQPCHACYSNTGFYSEIQLPKGWHFDVERYNDKTMLAIQRD